MTDSQRGRRTALRRPKVLAALSIVVAAGSVAAWYAVGQTPNHSGRADPSDGALVATGAKVYAKACASCHGANLEGEKKWRERKADGTFGAPPHDATGHTWHHPDVLLFRITKHGGASVAPPEFKSGMPAFKDQLSDREIWAVLAFIKSRWPLRVRTIQSRINERARQSSQ